MKVNVSKAALAILVLTAVAFAADSADARGKGRSGGGGRSAHSSGGHHHHHHRGHAFVGGAFFAPVVWPWYDYAPYAPLSGPVQYIEQSADSAAGGEWLYCASSQAYFPHVSECAVGWERVIPPPPPQG